MTDKQKHDEPPLAIYCGGADFGVWDDNMDCYWVCQVNDGDPQKAKNIVAAINGVQEALEKLRTAVTLAEMQRYDAERGRV